MKTARTILIAAAIATGLMESQAQAQTFQTNNGVIIGSPGVLPPTNNGGAIIPSPPGGPVPPMPRATNRWPRTNLPPWNTRTNLPWNVRTNGNMFPGTNGVRRVPISSNIPSTSIQPPDSSLPPMTNAPGQPNRLTQPGTVPNRQLDQPTQPPRK